MNASRISVDVQILHANDYALIARWLSDPTINRWLAGRWHGRSFSARHVGIVAASPSTRMFVIRRDGTPAGMVALSDIDYAERSAGVWYVIDSAERGKKLASTGLRQVASIAFEDLELLSLNAWVTSGNEASEHVLERVGFRPAGRLRRASLLDGESVDRLLFDLVAEDLADS